MKKLTLLAITFLVLVPNICFAHQPRVTSQTETLVTDPEISKAYYGEIETDPHFYNINSKVPFNLYVNILAPDIEGQSTNLVATITKDGEQIALLDGTDFAWESFWEEYGKNAYLKGPEFKLSAKEGDYQIKVESQSPNTKYSLAIGEAEVFGAKEIINAMYLVPQIKKDFFGESPANFILSPFGFSYVIVMFILAFIFGFIYRSIAKRLSIGKMPNGRTKNIGTFDRILRALLGTGLLILALTTTWNPLILLLSGFCFFEALFSWCAFYQAIGKNSCPL